MFLESVIRFYKRLVKDQDFRSQLETAASPEECRKMMQEAGYDFTQEEFETATAQILEKKGLRDLDDSFSELSEQELELAFGGFAKSYWGWKTPTDIDQDLLKKKILKVDEITLDGIALIGGLDFPIAITHYGGSVPIGGEDPIWSQPILPEESH